MKNKLLLSALSLSFLAMANVGHAGSIEDDFMVMSKTSSYNNSAAREQEKTVRNVYKAAIDTAQEVSQSAGQAAKSWWSWGASGIKSSGSSMVLGADIPTKFVGAGVWGIGWVLDKFSDAIGDSVSRHSLNTSTKAINKLTNAIADNVIVYNETDEDVVQTTCSIL